MRRPDTVLTIYGLPPGSDAITERSLQMRSLINLGDCYLRERKMAVAGGCRWVAARSSPGRRASTDGSHRRTQRSIVTTDAWGRGLSVLRRRRSGRRGSHAGAWEEVVEVAGPAR